MIDFLKKLFGFEITIESSIQQVEPEPKKPAAKPVAKKKPAAPKKPVVKKKAK